MGDNANHNAMLSEHSLRLCQVSGMPTRQPIWTLQRGVPYPIHIITHTNKKHRHLNGLESITDTSSCHFNIHKKRVAQVRITHL
jgi:hypothetical protein